MEWKLIVPSTSNYYQPPSNHQTTFISASTFANVPAALFKDIFGKQFVRLGNVICWTKLIFCF
jgi:hypothetical protein